MLASDYAGARTMGCRQKLLKQFVELLDGEVSLPDDVPECSVPNVPYRAP